MLKGLTKYVPGVLTAPTIVIFLALKFLRDTSTLTPMKDCSIMFDIFLDTSSKVSPTTLIDPISGNKTVPSRFTFKSKTLSFDPDKIIES